MTDRLPPARRSWLMSRVRGKDTTPELAVRRTAHALGYRFRLHRRDLPGTPDLVFPSRRAVIFVHGCFWHRHPFCRKASVPTSRVDFWNEKFDRNVSRDRRNVDELVQLGWRVLTIWECETHEKGRAALTARLLSFLGVPRSAAAQDAPDDHAFDEQTRLGPRL